jgi:hypothetical protein
VRELRSRRSSRNLLSVRSCLIVHPNLHVTFSDVLESNKCAQRLKRESDLWQILFF